MLPDSLGRTVVIEECKLISNSQLARATYAMELIAPGIAASVDPGQFVNILISEGWSPLLRRPMSVASRKADRIGLIYKVVGVGTRAMAEWPPGQVVNILGPLGNGWSVADDTFPVLVGGGAGIAPISFLHEDLNSHGREHYLLMGARGKAEHYLHHDPGKNITLTTDDGTVGLHGTAVDGLLKVLDQFNTGQITIFGCGPPPMLSALKDFVLERGLPCQLATETLMACGFGICQGCSVELKTDEDYSRPSYRGRFKLACVDGPVFWAHELA
ncbi:MAG: dihydroorotate dehydrogenase electron transfer subunit [Calditrichaeota bacterium]|nr:dihydroorotate dehydrogenase electron transfer subunit [Calditrichota bacterium]